MGAGLKPNQRRAIKLIAQGLTIRRVATELDISPNTIHVWRRTIPEFDLAVETELRIFEEEATHSLRACLPLAVSNVQRLMDCGNENVELGASKTVLDGWERLLRGRLVEQQLDELEKRMESLRHKEPHAAQPLR